MESDEVQLGGNIRLSGFREVDGGSMIVAKKIIGSYMKHYGELCSTPELSVVLKSIHQNEDNMKFEVHVRLLSAGEQFVSELVDKNLFVALDSALKKVESALSHKHQA